MDLTASILAATGTPVPPGASLDGIDLFPMLEGRAPEIERTLFWRVAGARAQQAVRSGEWKLLVEDGRPLLFNLQSDVGERRSLIGQRFDIARRLAAKTSMPRQNARRYVNEVRAQFIVGVRSQGCLTTTFTRRSAADPLCGLNVGAVNAQR